MVHPNEGHPDSIPLHWKISSFMPFPEDCNTEEDVRELINPDFFAEEHPYEACVSLAAMLTSTRFACCQMWVGQIRRCKNYPYHDKYDANTLQLEMDLNLIVAGIGKYNHWFSLLRSYVSYHEEFGNTTNYSMDQLTAWEDVGDFPFIQRFRENITPFPCQKSAFSGVDSKLQKVLEHKDSNLVSLAKCINQFVEDSLSPKKNANLKKLLEFIRRVLGKDVLSVTDPITTEAQLKEVEEHFRKAAEAVTAQLNSVDGNSASWVSDMNKAIQKATDWVYATNSDFKNDILSRYTSKNRGCIAILKYGFEYYLAFSGFNDCVDRYVLEKAGISVPLCQLASAFESVCKQLSASYKCKITYVPFTAQMTEHIERYTILDRDPQDPALYKPGYFYATTMDRDFMVIDPNSLPYPLAKSHYKANYSCCERKILAYLKSEGINDRYAYADWFIKFYPCIQCSHAIDRWRKDNHITRLRFEIPDLDS